MNLGPKVGCIERVCYHRHTTKDLRVAQDNLLSSTDLSWLYGVVQRTRSSQLCQAVHKVVLLVGFKRQMAGNLSSMIMTVMHVFRDNLMVIAHVMLGRPGPCA